MARTSTTCRTCCRPITEPFRVFATDGHVVSGCISFDHDGQLIPGTPSARWHDRTQAQQMREIERAIFLPLAEVAA